MNSWILQLSQKKFCQNFENVIKLWENDLIFCEKIVNLCSRLNLLKNTIKSKSTSTFYSEQTDLSIRSAPWIPNSSLDRLALGGVIHWFLAGNFCFTCCISWHSVDFIHPYFGLIFAGILNPNFVLCWLGSLYAAAGKFMFFLSTSHTICANMLIIHCTLFPKAVFLSSIRFLVFWWFLMRLWKFCI